MNIKDALVLIPARMGSKGIPFKNRRLLQGKPLLQYTLDIALHLFPKDRIVVSSDDPEILKSAQSAGLVQVINRPIALSGDDVPMMQVIHHALANVPQPLPEFLVLLQPTSPFRSPKDVLDSYALLSPEAQAVVSVRSAKDLPGYNTFALNPEGHLKVEPLLALQRQDMLNAYTLNGAIYWMRIADVMQLKSILELHTIQPYSMPFIRSLDIDTEEDWQLAEIFANCGYLPKL
jgi:N-acylneuraminate cytidylyltransferase